MKKFLEVFPDLHMTAEMGELFKLVEVERVSAARDRSSIRVYINSSRLIHKKNIFSLERGIRDQLSPGKQLTIKIIEKYTLSEQYNPEKLLRSLFLNNLAEKASFLLLNDQIRVYKILSQHLGQNNADGAFTRSRHSNQYNIVPHLFFRFFRTLYPKLPHFFPREKYSP